MALRKLPLPDVVERHYRVEGLNQQEIADRYGVSDVSVSAYMRRYGIARRSRRRLPGKAAINRLYWLEEWSIKRIAAHYGVTPRAVASIMERDGIPRRKQLRYRPTVECVECGRRTIEVKIYDPKRSGKPFYFRRTNRCAWHYAEMKRRFNREWARRHRGLEGTGRSRKLPVNSALIREAEE